VRRPPRLGRDGRALDVRRYSGQFDLLGTAFGEPARDMAGPCKLVTEYRVPPPVIDRIFALDEAGEAHERLESGAGLGKIVLLHG
jgi:zinc-binding alcohol dehydrogenase/oxidoreductase